jgi:two-component system chemotaxis sensor kinase CheA
MTDDFESQLKAGFLDEARQLLVESEQCFLLLEQNPQDPAIIERIFRIAHSFKGSAGVAGFDQLSEFAHHFESLLTRIKSALDLIDAPMMNVLLRANDQLGSMVEGLGSDMTTRFDLTEVLASLDQALSRSGTEAEQPHPTSLPPTSPVSLDGNPEEAFAEPTDQGRLPLPRETSPRKKSHKLAADESIRVNLARIDRLVNDVGELVILQTMLSQNRHMIPSALLQRTVGQLSKITKSIQETSISLRMLPLRQTFLKLQRTVRDTSQALGKRVRFEMSGDGTEIDKTILDLIGDPLVHLIRNAVDHGIEASSDDRQSRGKDPEGLIWLKAYQESRHIVIEVGDDGRGLDAGVLRTKAAAKGLLDPKQSVSDQEAYHLIFAAGFSTKDDVSEISGRGVGMDVVRTNIEQLQGDIEIATTKGQGTTFKITLPLTLAIIDAMVIQSGSERYVVPVAAVHESIQLRPDDVSTVGERQELLNVRGATMPLYRLGRLLKSREAPHTIASEAIVLVVRHGTLGSFGVLVDGILGQQQVVIKRLGEEVQGLAGLSGAAILSDGRAALILDLLELVEVPLKGVSHRKTETKEAA